MRHEASRLAAETGGIFVALDVLIGLASLRAKRGELEQALEWLSLVLRHLASTQDTRHRAARQCAEVEAQLTSQQIEAAQRRAQTNTLENIVDEILRQIELA